MVRMRKNSVKPNAAFQRKKYPAYPNILLFNYFPI